MAGRPAEQTDFANARLAVTLLRRPTARIADIGCGDGSLLALLAPGILDGLGVAPTQEEVDRLRAVHVGCPNLSWEVGTTERIPGPDHCFDLVVCNGVFICLGSPAQAGESLKEIHRVVKPGGTAWVGEVPSRPSPAIPRESISGFLFRRLRSNGVRAFLRSLRRVAAATVGLSDLYLSQPEHLVLPESELRSLAEDAGFSRVDASPTVHLGPNGVPLPSELRVDYRLLA